MAKLKIVITPKAELDVREIVKYIARDKKDVASRFLDNFQEDCYILQGMPEIGKSVKKNFSGINSILEDVRSWSIRKFRNYFIFYKKTESKILILRVVNASRNLPILFDK